MQVGAIGQIYDTVLIGVVLVLAVLIVISIIRSILLKNMTSRIITINMIGTMVIMLITILSVFLNENYLVDMALIYALLSFLAVIVLTKVYTGVYLEKKQMMATPEAMEDNLQHQKEAKEDEE